MPVSVKDYLDTMKSVSSSMAVAANKKNDVGLDTKTQALLSQLIEAISYANSIDFRKKSLNKEVASGGLTGKEVLQQLKAQEKLVQQLAEGQKMTKAQNKELTSVINKFYEVAGANEINYKKFAAQLEKFALKGNLPEAVQTRLVNDSRDAHIIGKEQKDSSGLIMPILKRIRNLLEDSAESSKQFGKKLFVTLDAFRESFLGAFDKFKEGLKEGGGLIDNIVDAIKMAGMAWMLLQGKFKEGKFGFGQLFKQINNIQTAFKAFAEVAKSGAKIKGPIKAIKDLVKGAKLVGKGIADIPKAFKGLKGLGDIGKMFKGIGKGLGTVGKGVSKGLGKGVLKKIPLVGTALSIWMGIERWKKKDYLGAFLEFGSGVAAIFPGVGTLISIGLDLINLERDTGILKKGMSKAAEKLPQLNENALMSIPGIGPIFGISKAIGLFKTGNKKGGMVMLGKALASVVPGGAFIADMVIKLMGLDKDIKPDPASTASTEAGKTAIDKINSNPNATRKIVRQKPGTTGTKVDDFEWEDADKKEEKKPWYKPWGDGPFGDAPIRWQNESGGYSPRGLTQNAKSAAENMNKLLGGGMTVTSAFRDPAKMMAEWNAATPIPGSRNRRNRWGNEMADPRRSNHRFGTAIDVPMGLYRRIGANKFTALAKKAGFNLVYPEHSAVHLEVPKSGNVSEIKNGDSGGYFGSNEPVYEDNQAIANAEGEMPATFESVMEAFNKFNEDLAASLPTSDTTGSVSPATSGPEAPSIEAMTAGTPQASTASSSAATAKATSTAAANSTAPAQQTVQTSMDSGSQSTMDTEIRDTDLALLNSLLFQ